MSSCCPVVELRQYTLRYGPRGVLIELVDREFVGTQEAAGMEVIGQFRDLDRPERVVWVQRVVDENWPAPMDLNLALDAPPLQLCLATTARSRLR